LWTVTKISIRESHELSGYPSGHIQSEMESQFGVTFSFWQHCCFSARTQVRNITGIFQSFSAPYDCTFRGGTAEARTSSPDQVSVKRDAVHI
jgi:hypothetical protein